MINSDNPALLSDLELLIALCSSNSDDRLYETFVQRFYNDLKTECAQICIARGLDKHTGEQIVHDTFERVRKYKSFQADAVTIPDSHKGILVYLIRIARNLFNDQYRQQRKDQQAPPVHKAYFDDIAGGAGIQDPEKLNKIRTQSVAIFKKLNAKEQKVLLTDMEYKRQYKYLPDDVTDELSTELGVTKSSIRKIRARGWAKIKSQIDEINQPS